MIAVADTIVLWKRLITLLESLFVDCEKQLSVCVCVCAIAHMPACIVFLDILYGVHV